MFLSVHLTGDPALYLLGPEGTREDYEQLKRNLGLDKPVPVQYAVFLGNLLRGDFGISPITGQSARSTLMERFPATLQLAGVAFILTMVVGIPLGEQACRTASGLPECSPIFQFDNEVR